MKNFFSTPGGPDDKAGSNEFEDIYFEPDVRNISYIDKNIKTNKMITKKDIEELQKLKFEKISELASYSKYFANKALNKKAVPLPTIDITTFPKVSSDASFGSYGNVNLYNCIMFLVKKENWFKNTILRIDMKRKIFVIRVYIQGKPKDVLLDENVPIFKNEKDESVPAFINKLEQFWISLIEKAFAKINRSYGNILRSLASEIYPVITNAPIFTIRHNNSNIDYKIELWNSLNDAIEAKNIIVAELESISLENFSPLNFLSYYVTNIFRTAKYKYVELIVPEYHCKALKSLKEKTFNEISKEDLKDKEIFSDEKLNNKHIILINFDSYFNIFYKTVIVKYYNDYHYSFKKIKYNSNRFNMVKIKVNTTSKIYLTLHMKQVRYYIKHNSYDTPLSRLIVAKLSYTEKYLKLINNENMHMPDINNSNLTSSNHNNNDFKHSYVEEDYDVKLEYQNSAYGKQEKLTIELDLEQGEYYVFFKIYKDIDTNVVLSTYSDNEVSIEENLNEMDMKIIKNKNNSYLLDSLYEMFSSYLDSKSNDQIILNEINMFYSNSLHDNKLGFSVARLENNSKNSILHVNFSYLSYGMNLISHEKAKRDQIDNSTSIVSARWKEINLSIFPQSREIVVFEWVKNLNEVSINVKPFFKIEPIQPVFIDKTFSHKIKNYISEEIFYYEVPYYKGVYLILANEGIKENMVGIDFDTLDNLFILYPPNVKGRKSLDLFIGPETKIYINLRILKNQDFSFKLNFRVTDFKSDNKDGLNLKNMEITTDKIHSK